MDHDIANGAVHDHAQQTAVDTLIALDADDHDTAGAADIEYQPHHVPADSAMCPASNTLYQVVPSYSSSLGYASFGMLCYNYLIVYCVALSIWRLAISLIILALSIILHSGAGVLRPGPRDGHVFLRTMRAFFPSDRCDRFFFLHIPSSCHRP